MNTNTMDIDALRVHLAQTGRLDRQQCEELLTECQRLTTIEHAAEKMARYIQLMILSCEDRYDLQKGRTPIVICVDRAEYKPFLATIAKCHVDGQMVSFFKTLAKNGNRGSWEDWIKEWEECAK